MVSTPQNPLLRAECVSDGGCGYRVKRSCDGSAGKGSVWPRLYCQTSSGHVYGSGSLIARCHGLAAESRQARHPRGKSANRPMLRSSWNMHPGHATRPSTVSLVVPERTCQSPSSSWVTSKTGWPSSTTGLVLMAATLRGSSKGQLTQTWVALELTLSQLRLEQAAGRRKSNRELGTLKVQTPQCYKTFAEAHPGKPA
jgi:hypothetical protein